jgi:Ca-activated chloride channel family protein
VLAVLIVALVGGYAPEAAAQQPSPAPTGLAPVLFVLDASGSMRGDDGTGRTKFDAAREALRQLFSELPDGAPVGLRVYGHRVPNTDRENGCRDTELLVPVGPLDRGRMAAVFGGLEARGYTPIGTSLLEGLNDLPSDGPRTMVLVSDGIDTCAPPDPCEVARQLAAANVDLRIETIGFQTDAPAAAQLRCIAEVTGGSFYAAANANELLRALRRYEVTGTRTQGEAELPDAASAEILTNGQYRDSIAVGEQRWYPIELQPGQSLRTAATIVGRPDGPVSPTARFRMEVRSEDVLGAVTCGIDEVERIGQEARQVTVDGLVVAEQGLCQDPGRYAIGITLLDEEGNPSPIGLEDYEVELLVNVVDNPATLPAPLEPGPESALDGLVDPAADAQPVAATGPAPGTYLLAGLAAAAVGALVGALLAWRLV